MCVRARICEYVCMLEMILSHKSLKYAWEWSTVGNDTLVLEETACAPEVSLGLPVEVVLQLRPDPPTQSHYKVLWS